MRATAHDDNPAATPRLPAQFDLDVARSMIGRGLRLRQSMHGFAAGTPCRVQCVVDFGAGLLLWITTNDERSVDVDQIDAEDLQRFFEVLDAPAAGRSNTAARSDEAAPTVTGSLRPETGSQRTGLGQRLAAFGRRIAGIAASLPQSIQQARYAQQLLGMSDAQLAARGLDRARVMDHLRERLGGHA